MFTTRLPIAVACVALVLSWPATATANGGAYLEFDETYYVAGDAASAEAYVYVPSRRADLFERGPFWLYALPEGGELREGRPAPPTAIRLGELTLTDERKGSYELEARFTMPQLATGEYAVAMCNDPCTVSGFGEPLSGWFTVAGSRREADLLRRNDALLREIGALERRLKRAAKVEDVLMEQLADAATARAAAREEIASLRAQLDAARTASSDAVPLVDRWGAAMLAAAVVALAVVLARAGRRRPFAAAGVGVPRRS